MAELLSMSDRDLRDIGIDRCEILRAVRGDTARSVYDAMPISFSHMPFQKGHQINKGGHGGLALLDAFDRQRQVDLAARLVARHHTLGHPVQVLIATLARALLREDAGFHAYQVLDAGVRQFGAWGNTDEGRHVLIAVARYLAAHSPTERAELQTADIARRLMRGGELHRDTTA
jgi:hypothetical protein